MATVIRILIGIFGGGISASTSTVIGNVSGGVPANALLETTTGTALLETTTGAYLVQS